ncbi:MAG: hypothetical protein L3J37_09425 [Rhodobacteraceae bacterium]|nr:hypothetical protein [Paracoccaceae bacterium]
MPIQPEHELHTRRKGRNMAVGLILGGIIALSFAVTIVKLSIPQNEDMRAPNFSTTLGAANE